jgi:sugar lactone lactonase YvrE
MSDPRVPISDDVEVVLDAKATLGEGPSWDDATGTLIWVDISGRTVHRFDPRTQKDEVRPVQQDVGAAVPHPASGGIALAVKDGFALIPSGPGPEELRGPAEKDQPDARMNDGKCDGLGRFWAGTQRYDLRPGAGSMYRWELDGSVTRVFGDITISNGLGWSPDDRTMYFIDTAKCTVDAMDYVSETGAVSNRRKLVDLPARDGGGDGMTVDAEGFLWVAMWDGWAVRRFTPDGALDRIIRLPCSHVTSVCFGGPDLTDLYITSGRVNETGPLPPKQLAKEPLAGAIFRARPGVRGLPTHPYRG